ncbi:hypothetical protein BWR10_12545 [Lacticaseibacillus rhamnosus]|uniref:ATP-dependent nuclease subunit B n=1 Tax=Lacticaseibacillus rhamnosus TaxID=47715 RepID=A0AAX0K203_LACRH|nr:hypothetical protein BWR10_12545 [Lacticaseibacillus rhamnosus]
MFSFTSITRSPAQESACKDLGRNDQNPAITPEATYSPVMPITRSPAQGSACKDLRRNGQERAITPEATCSPLCP